MPDDIETRRLPVGQFGLVDVAILDPYTIALSKIDRGFDTDLDDIIFLLKQGLIQLERLEEVINKAMVRSQEFDLDPTAMRAHLQAVRERFAAQSMNDRFR